MKAVILNGPGDLSQLNIAEVPTPSIQPDELLIKTKAFSINPIEVKTRKGNVFTDRLLDDKPSILGWDTSGVVDRVGPEIKGFKPGDRVFGVIGFPGFGKTYADYITAKESNLCKIPDSIGFEEASVSTIAALTAYQAMHHCAKLKPGKKVLIHAATGGVGHFGVQLAKHLGAEVVATASGEKRDFAIALGADRFIDYKTQDFEDEARDMDVVFDLIGGPYIQRSLRCLKTGGMLISIPSVSNGSVEEMAKKAGRTGIRFMMENNQNDLRAIAHLLADKKLKPYISKRFTIDQIREAHAALEKGHTKGKIAVIVP